MHKNAYIQVFKMNISDILTWFFTKSYFIDFNKIKCIFMYELVA